MESSPYSLNLSSNILQERRRLERNHWELWLPLFKGSLLPPHILAQLSVTAGPRVADIGTGTGVWLSSLAPVLAGTARLDGFDFDTSKFPGPSELPPNVTLSLADIREPFPQELQGQYDVIHIRLLVFALRGEEDWQRCIENLITLLKPGGWLVWEDVSLSLMTTLPPSMAWFRVLCAMDNATKQTSTDFSVPARQLNMFEKAGLMECSELAKSTSAEDVQAAANNCMCDGMQQYFTGMVKRGGVDGLRTEDEVQTLFGDLRQDFDSGHRGIFDMRRTCGRKATA